MAKAPFAHNEKTWRVHRSARQRLASAVAALWLAVSSHTISALDLGVPIAAPLPLNTNAAGDSGRDQAVRISVDNSGHWIAVWQSNENLNGSLGGDNEIFFARSEDRGITWTAPAVLNTNAGDDGVGVDRSPCIATDGSGNWIAAWDSNAAVNGSNGLDIDILVARSANNGLSWSAPIGLNENALTDSGNDFDIEIDTDGAGTWIAVWRSLDSLGGTIGTDADILLRPAL